MRNLKKFLALVLAMMMAFSLMVTANAANQKDNGSYKYNDTDAISEEFVEAVDVLYGMGVMTGDYGNFKPGDPIMRSEMAAILYRLMTGDTAQLKQRLYADIAAERFEDVTADVWFAPYIGWCYDAGIMVGSNGYFRPNDNVTGYETVVMVLRAMGYGKNHEYTGADWYIKASSDATLAHLLDGVKSAHYSYALSQNSNREVVASIVFQGATRPTVRYELGYYNQYVGVASGATAGNFLNASLGVKNFGLASTSGVIVGNQSTGEVVTRLNVPTNKSTRNDNYKYDPTGDQGSIRYLDWTTDLRLFGHMVTVWYRGDTIGSNGQRVAGGRGTGSDKYPLKTYAIYDDTVLAKVVKATVDTDLTATTAATDAGKLGHSVKNAGFKVDATDGAMWNFSFGITDTTGETSKLSFASPIVENNQDGANAPYYLVISNNEDKYVDLVISLDLTVTRISQSGGDVWGTEFVSVNNGVANNYFGLDADQVKVQDTFGADKGIRVNILTDSLGTGSTTDLQADVVAMQITGTTPGSNDGAQGQNTGNYNNSGSVITSTYYHELFKLTQTVTKVVIARDPRTQTVTFDDGTTMARSWLADTVADNRLLDLGVDDKKNSEENIKRSKAPTVKGTYTFTYVENEEGEKEYIFWAEPRDTKTFIYATYLDYDQEVASSTFKYPMVGVISGKMETKNITNGTEPTAKGGAGSYLDPMDATHYMDSDLPKRDNSTGQTMIGAQVYPGIYQGYYIDGTKITPVIAKDNQTETWKQGDTTYFGAKDIEIASRDANVGAVLVGRGAAGTGLYLTNGTKIHVVSGTGTDTQKVTTYNGVKDFLDKSTKVTINGTGVTKGSDDLKSGTNFYDMIYWTQVASTYAQDYTTTAWDVSEVYIPLEAIKRDGATESSLYFIGDRTPTLWNNNGEPATLFTFYDKDGNAVNLWISGIAGRNPGTAGDSWNDGSNTTAAAKIVGAKNGNFFLNLVPTSKKANDGQTIYTVAVVSSAKDGGSDYVNNDLGIIGQYIAEIPDDGQIVLGDANKDDSYKYIATSHSQNLASIGNSRAILWGVGSTKVVNLDEDNYPGVKNVVTLNAVSSMGTSKDNYNANLGVSVSAFRNKDANVNLDVVFVNSTDLVDGFYVAP